ncbi:unnamed protein product [Brassicogethes aeneus]|uniref:Tetratricopeptide repeat protein 5 OB fold domain-containing protein n=1 Tax=Brassicogethes aeneus TaxID=1431903 RepID=A0A9P0BCS5_BRAAE|nr:unnamed protein product [Brassicogethes aeneus]
MNLLVKEEKDVVKEYNPTCFCKESKDEIVKCLEEKVDYVYSFRDRFFENHDIKEAINKNADVEKLMLEMLSIFDKHESLALQVNKARYNYLRGKLLNVMPKFNVVAESLLSKACKLDPKMLEAWNELGECYWKNEELQKAKNCFEMAAKDEVKKNKIALRNLSMIARQEICENAEERNKNIRLGLNYAKEAVRLDTHDGISWSILGNAHLSSFFGIHQNPQTLKRCINAYSHAEKDVIARSTPDLHYNKGITLKYEEEFLLALESFKRASSYDPTWEPPKIKERQLLEYLREINDLVSTRGKMKAKRLQQILQSIDAKQLGPFGGGGYTSSGGKTVKLEETLLNDLKTGLNEEKVVLGKVVCSIRNDDTVPFTFCLVDTNCTCVVVTIYNLASGKGVIIGDSVAIPEPFVTDVDFSYNDKKYKFRLIRVENPLILVINSKKGTRELMAGVQMSLFKKFD